LIIRLDYDNRRCCYGPTGKPYKASKSSSPFLKAIAKNPAGSELGRGRLAAETAYSFNDRPMPFPGMICFEQMRAPYSGR
jgi:hypothetical protein